MPTQTLEPPKQADYSKISQGAVSDWMTGLKTAEGATTQPEPPTTPVQPDTTPEPAAPTQPPAARTEPPTQVRTEPEPTDAPESPDKWPRSAAEWKKFIKVRDDNYLKRDSRIKELESKLTETEKALKGLPTDPATFETIKTERERYEKESKDLSERLRLAAIESHPKFKAYYDNKITAQIDLAKRIAGPDRAESIAEALRLPDGPYKASRIEELSTDLSPVAASRLGSVLNAIEEINQDRASQIAQAKNDFDAAQSKAQADHKAAQERTAADANARFESIVRQASDPKDGIILFQPREGDKAWNDSVKARIDGARATIFGNGKQADPDALIRKALVAEAFPALLESYNGLLKEVATFKDQVSKLTAASPSIDARQSKDAPGSKQPSKPGSRPMDVAREWMTGLQQTSQS